jgi:hypothetical protein
MATVLINDDTTVLINDDESEFVPEHCVRYFRGADGSFTYVVVERPQQGSSLFRVREIDGPTDALMLELSTEVTRNGHAGVG